MKAIFLTTFLLLFSISGFAQDYSKESPISIAVASNGNLQRVECSVYDSVLQTTVYFNTPWIPKIIIISGNAYGKVGFTTWNSIGIQNSMVGIIIYDNLLHNFNYQYINTGISGSTQNANVVCGIIWVEVLTESFSNNDYYLNFVYYRYHPLFHKWIKVESFGNFWDLSSTSIIWNHSSIGNTDRLLDVDDVHLFYYDPVRDTLYDELISCVGNVQDEKEDYYISNQNCNNYSDYFMYDAQLKQFQKYPRNNVDGRVDKGIFTGKDVDTTAKKFFFVYDPAIQQWVTDSVFSSNLINIKVKDRIVAYIDSSQNFGKQMFCMAYHPVQHTWIKDSTQVAGNITGYIIQNGTVKWNDSNGNHARGYDNNVGWGNFNTIPFLNFHLTDFTVEGLPMIHVRNLSIGADSVIFNFGDGVSSKNSRHVFWHSYNESGTYDVCILDSSGTQSWCQQITMNLCATVSAIGSVTDTLCEGDSTLLSVSYTGNTIQWQKKNGNSWSDETGPGATAANYFVSPSHFETYRVVVTDPNCLTVYSQEKNIYVNGYIGNSYYLADTTIITCANTARKLELRGTLGSPTFVWQRNLGSGWANVSSTNDSILVIGSTLSALYRVIISSGSCFIDTSVVISVTINSALPSPSTIPDYVCGQGVVDLIANGSGVMLWSQYNVDSLLHIGNTFSPYITAQSTFRVYSSNTNLIPVGYTNNSIGTIDTISATQKGIRLFSSEPTFIENFTIYPAQTGSVIFRLYHSNTQTLITAVTKVVNANAGGQKIWLRAYLQGNTSYDLVVDSFSVPLLINTSGISYPITSVPSSIVITGYVDSVFHNTPDFYNIYNINATEGCRSNLVNVYGNVYTEINAIVQHTGSLVFCQGDSVKLNATPTGNYTRQWLKNGIFTGVTSLNYTVHTPGSYQVIVSNNTCSGTSAAVNVRVPCINTFDSEEKSDDGTFASSEAQFNIHYSALTGELDLDAVLNEDEFYTLLLMDPTGKEVLKEEQKFSQGKSKYSINVQRFSSGLYILKLQSENNRFVKRWMKN